MRLLRRSAGARIAMLAISLLLVIAAFALPSIAAHRNEFITGDGRFEPAPSECATGTFVADGVFDAHGDFRTCGRNFRVPGIVIGTIEMHNSDDLTLKFKAQCRRNDDDNRTRHFDCKGQWEVNGPNWQGAGNLRITIDLTTGEFDYSAQGNLTAL
jgi:hypothetical protein